MLSPIFLIIAILNLVYLNHQIFVIDFLFTVLIIINPHPCLKEKHKINVTLF